jgi:hypothetical protein
VKFSSDYVLGLCTRLAHAGLIETMKVDEVDFFRLKAPIPKIEKEGGQLDLYKISEDPEWGKIAVKCNVPTEDVLYQDHKKHMRDTVFGRVMKFAGGLDKMREEGLGVYLHSAYYKDGILDPGAFNAFYVLFGFEKWRKTAYGGPSQARLLAEKCVELGRRIILCVPGESFLPSELRESEDSYIRAVALSSEAELGEVLQTISLVAREIKNP